ncbi:MAG TPA: FHA domain-containing protein [Anaerolineae bacterium]|nr:FHA domain-containing protein [Anaerolineae bacterium]
MSESAFRLIVRTGPNPGMVFDLTKEVTLFGRDVTNDIVLGDVEVSRQHARLTHTLGGYVLEDLGSTNGSFVNGERMIAPRTLNPGDLIGFGENVTLNFEAVSPDAAATIASHAAAPTPSPYPAQQPHVATPTPVAPIATPVPGTPGEAALQKRRLPIILAGGGCLVVLLACIAVMYWMPISWWCALLTPLRALGIAFEGC